MYFGAVTLDWAKAIFHMCNCKIHLQYSISETFFPTGSLNSSSADLSENAIRSGHKVKFMKMLIVFFGNVG